MVYYFPFRVVKGKALRVYTAFTNATNNYGDTAGGTNVAFVSKDGAQFVAAENALVHIASEDAGTVARSRYYIQLTATEMNADVIVLATKTSVTGQASQTVIINTVPEELSAAPTKQSSLEDKITAVFQYLFGKREVTATEEKIYKDDGDTVLGTATISDNGTTVGKTKIS